jgi:hypothetical protein
MHSLILFVVQVFISSSIRKDNFDGQIILG